MTVAAIPVVLPSAADRIRAALWFADHGFGVFSCWSTRANSVCRCPAGAGCGSPGKHPITANGFKDATTDPARIRTALSAASDPNYGLVCPDGVFTWDVDGESWAAGLAALEARYGPLPPTLRTETAYGQHVFLRWPTAHPRPLHEMFGYVTRWGSGSHAGYVIGPRSVHASGAVYSPMGVAEIAELPDAWARAVVAAETSPILTVTGPIPVEQVQEGHRHNWLRNRARHMAGVIRDPGVLRTALLAENARLAAPKTEAEVDRAIGEVLVRFDPDPMEADPETGEIIRTTIDDLGLLPPAAAGEFPPVPMPLAYGGLLGECALELAHGTDASLVGLLGSLIAFTGALIPGMAYQHRMQTSSPYVALVGESSVGRKGTAMWRVHDAMSEALEPIYVNRVVLDGLNSGEGLISTLQHKQTTYPYEPTAGLVFEEEYASLLASRGREGSTLDPKMRAAFDGGPLSNRKAAGTQTVSPPYWLPALIAITPTELRKRLEPDALQSGSANRWLYLPVVRRVDVVVSEPPRFSGEHREALQLARRWALADRPSLSVAKAVTRTLSEYADFLPGVSSGTARDLTRRMAVIAFRVALVHALAERSPVVTLEHLDRALALTEYARSGIDWVFGGTVGNRDADILLRNLQKSGSLQKRTIERELIRDPIRRQDAIDELVRLGYAVVATVHTTGRPRTELQMDPRRGASGPFVRVFDERDESDKPPHAGISVRSAQSDSQKLDKSPEDGAPKSPEGTGEWLRPCHDYVHHQSDHHRTGAGWICAACDAARGEEST